MTRWLADRLDLHRGDLLPGLVRNLLLIRIRIADKRRSNLIRAADSAMR